MCPRNYRVKKSRYSCTNSTCHVHLDPSFRCSTRELLKIPLHCCYDYYSQSTSHTKSSPALYLFAIRFLCGYVRNNISQIEFGYLLLQRNAFFVPQKGEALATTTSASIRRTRLPRKHPPVVRMGHLIYRAIARIFAPPSCIESWETYRSGHLNITSAVKTDPTERNTPLHPFWGARGSNYNVEQGVSDTNFSAPQNSFLAVRTKLASTNFSIEKNRPYSVAGNT